MTPNDDPYKLAGVDILKGSNVAKNALALAATRKTHPKNAVLSHPNGFAALFDPRATPLNDPVIAAAADGVGTKIIPLQEQNLLHVAGHDLVAMNVNDLLAVGAKPLFFLDYISSSPINPDHVADILRGVADACASIQCALIGGETAETPDVLLPNRIELAGFAVGVVEREHILPKHNLIKPKHTLIALPSDGPHANGFSLIRKLLPDNIPHDALKPTRIYVNPVLQLLNNVPHVHGIAHITGGGLIDNIPRIWLSNPNLAASIQLPKLPPFFQLIQRTGQLSNNHMAQIFNCGVGLVLALPQQHAQSAVDALKRYGERPFLLGEIVPASPNSPPVQVQFAS